MWCPNPAYMHLTSEIKFQMHMKPLKHWRTNILCKRWTKLQKHLTMQYSNPGVNSPWVTSVVIFYPLVSLLMSLAHVIMIIDTFPTIDVAAIQAANVWPLCTSKILHENDDLKVHFSYLVFKFHKVWGLVRDILKKRLKSMQQMLRHPNF